MKRQSGKGYHKGYYKRILCLLWLSFILFWGGCSGGEYGAEKLFWRANKSYVRLLKNLKAAKPEDFQKVIISFRRIVLQYPKWPNSAQAQFSIGLLYAMQNNNVKGKTEFEKVLKNYPKNADVCANAQFSIGKIYESQDNWDKALVCYKKITIDYPYTHIAYQIPLYIAGYYKRKNQDAQAEATYKEAIERYKSIVKEHPNTLAAITAQNFIVASLLDQKKWNEAVEYLQSLVDVYPGSALARKSLYTMGAIYQKQLNQLQKAINIYQELIEKYPDSKEAKSAKEQIKTIIKSTTKEVIKELGEQEEFSKNPIETIKPTEEK